MGLHGVEIHGGSTPPHDTPLRGGTIVKNAASQLKAEVLKVGVGAITALLEP